MLLQSVSALNLRSCIGLPAEPRGRWLQRALSPRGGTNPVTSAFFLLRCHQQPIREHLNRDIKSWRREGGQQRTAYGGSRCPHNMTPTHSGLLDGALINDDSPHSQTSSMPLTHTTTTQGHEVQSKQHLLWMFTLRKSNEAERVQWMYSRSLWSGSFYFVLPWNISVRLFYMCHEVLSRSWDNLEIRL